VRYQSALVIGVVASLGTGLAGCSSGAPASAPTTNTTTTVAPSTSTTPSTTPTTTATPTTTGIIDPYRATGWIARENAKPGTSEWRITDDGTDPIKTQPTGWLEAYANATSATTGDKITLFVDTPAASFNVAVYRMGWYGGTQARLITQTGPFTGHRQSAPVIDNKTHMAEAHWQTSATLLVDSTWPPGAYLLRLSTPAGGAHFVPLTVRHPGTAARLTLMNAVSTWQAYNPWGGCTLYECFGKATGARADVVSFDRPYSTRYGRGSADFLTHELPLISFAEQQGIDIDYITSVDLDHDPSLARAHNGLITTGHDEYYSTSMREALVAALGHGTNIAFFGANAVYRHVRLEPGTDGTRARRMVNYRSTADPAAKTDPQAATVNWREPPLKKPEAELVGLQYGCAGVRADLKVANPTNWLFEGANATMKQRVPNLIGVEFDELAPTSITPAGVEVLAATVLTCRGQQYQQVTAYRATTSGAGVFASGSIDWSCGLDGTCPKVPRSDLVRAVTANVLRAFALPRAGITHPSTDNTRRFRVALPPPSGGGGGSSGGGGVSSGSSGGGTPDTSPGTTPDTAPAATVPL
jgi:hypothetical protein